jgi:hypothetical protein
MSFSSDVEKFAKKVGMEMIDVRRRIFLEMVNRAVMRSPVAEPWNWKKPKAGYVGGSFRAAWQGTVGAPASTDVNRKDASAPMAEARAAAASINGDEPLFATNCKVYGPALEEGWSDQAPMGIVGLIEAEMAQMVEEALRG